MRDGFAIWLLVALAAGIGWLRLGWLESVLLLAMWVIVPTGICLMSPSSRWFSKMARIRPVMYIAVASAVLAFGLPAGVLAAGLTVPWVLSCALIASEGIWRIVRSRFQSFAEFCFAAGEGYLAVGGTWLLMSRMGMHPAGFDEPIVLLTAVHFHFAGFLTALVAGLVSGEMARTRGDSVAKLLMLGAITGPGLLGMAFLAGPKLKLGAVALIFIGECGLGWAMLQSAFASGNNARRSLRLAASAALLAAISLAVLWAIGEYPLQPIINLQRMEQVHGALNAFGFGFLALLSFVAFERKDSPFPMGESLAEAAR